MRIIKRQIVLILLVTGNLVCFGQTPILHWSFDSSETIQKTDSTSGIMTLKEGVSGKALEFDGYSTELIRKTPEQALSAESFTITAWIAPQEYSWNISAIINQQKEMKSGYLFGINHIGKLVAGISIDNEWKTFVSADSIPLLKWSFVTLKFEKNIGITFFINGKEAGKNAISGSVNYASGENIVIGKTQFSMAPAFTERKTSMDNKFMMHFDGLIDEMKLYGKALNSNEITTQYNSVKLKNIQPLAFRKMPSGSDKPMPFGAYYTKLQYAPGWDSLWAGSEAPDVVVRFGNNPSKLIFWRGTGYIPALVSENGIWMTDQSLENFGTGECYEAMGDKQCRYSHVRIIENSPARCVIHWRHALAGIKHQVLHESVNGHGDWADEYWTVYPDGVAVRKQVLWTDFWEEEKKVYQFQETIFFNQPGTKPQDNVEYNAIEFADIDGNKADYSWENGAPKAFDKTKFQAIQLINFKSKYKPFGIFTPDRITFPFNYGWVKGYSTFPCWNHWPVSQIASDGRNAVAPDKPSHSSLTLVNGDHQVVEMGPNNSVLTRSLVGMTSAPIDSLLPLARSWNFPPSVKMLVDGFSSLGFDKYQRSYNFENTSQKSKQLEFELEASAKSPVCNLSLVIKNWNSPTAVVEVDGKKKQLNKDYFICYQPGLDTNEMVIWIYAKSAKTTKIKIL
jgi:hypothetical protein